MRSRNWVFTINNPSDEHIFALRSVIDGGRAKFIQFQGERGEGGTPHLQGVVVFNDAVELRHAKLRLGTPVAHLEPMRGTFQQAIDYSSKEETRALDVCEPYEGGLRPANRVATRGARTDWDAIRQACEEGKDLATIAADFPQQAIVYSRGISTLSSAYYGPRRAKTQILWYYGSTGTGKSRKAFEDYPDAYVKMGDCKWWDGYSQQSCVVIDDYRPSLCPFNELLRLLDRYPHRVECKGSSIHFNSPTLIITTPKSPRETWASRTEEDIAQLIRRIDEIRNFDLFPYPQPAGARAEGPRPVGGPLVEGFVPGM